MSNKEKKIYLDMMNQTVPPFLLTFFPFFLKGERTIKLFYRRWYFVIHLKIGKPLIYLPLFLEGYKLVESIFIFDDWIVKVYLKIRYKQKQILKLALLPLIRISFVRISNFIFSIQKSLVWNQTTYWPLTIRLNVWNNWFISHAQFRILSTENMKEIFFEI